MKRGYAVLFVVGAALALAVLVAGPVRALEVKKVRIKNGVIEVKGKGAEPNDDILWEGEIVTQASGKGSFGFETTVLPGDCVGEVADGVESADAVIGGCGPQGVSGYELVHVMPAGNPLGEVTIDAACPAGKTLLGGGFVVWDGVPLNKIRGAGPSFGTSTTTYTLVFHNDVFVGVRVRVTAICAYVN